MLRIHFHKCLSLAALVTALQVATPVAAAESPKEPVRTASAETVAIQVAPQHKTAEKTESSARKSSGWGMIAAGLCVALLIISRRRT